MFATEEARGEARRAVGRIDHDRDVVGVAGHVDGRLGHGERQAEVRGEIAGDAGHRHRVGAVRGDRQVEHHLVEPELVAHVADWTPARAAVICGVDAATIELLAHDWGTIRPAAIRTLIGAEHHENGAMFYRTLAVLPALVGAWRDRGGGLSRSVGSYQDAVVDAAAFERPDLLAGRAVRRINMSRLGEALTDASLDPPVGAHAAPERSSGC